MKLTKEKRVSNADHNPYRSSNERDRDIYIRSRISELVVKQHIQVGLIGEITAKIRLKEVSFVLF